MLRILFVFTLLISSHLVSAEWHEKIHPSIEVGMHLSDFDGTIENVNSSSSFQNDFGYTDTSSSYFTFELKLDYDYAPNVEVSYFNDKQNSNSTFTKYTEIADGKFDVNETVHSSIDYQVLNVVLYKDFKKKGSMVRFFGKSFYTGDIEFDVGLNLKYIDWYFNVRDNDGEDYWDEVNSIIPLPYIGFKYYYYRLQLYANISALSFSEAKSTNYEFGLYFRVIDDLYMGASYIYEGFEATVEKDDHIDTVDFNTAGNKISFKYVF